MSSGQKNEVRTDRAPRPVGAYPHARRAGPLLFVSGMGPRRPGTDEIPGGPIRDPDGLERDYDVEAQTRSVIENVRAVLEAAGARLEDVVDVTVFLVDMDRDFATFNRVYAEYFAAIGPTRTTVAITALPTPIAVELKCIAWLGENAESSPSGLRR
jgi:2-aminomuconate deaminase